MAKTKVDTTGVILALVGAAVYLYVVYLGQTAGWANTTAGIFTPVLLGIGAVATLSLLVVSLSGLLGEVDKMASGWATKANFLAGIALFALTGGVAFWYVAFAFVLSHFGTGKMNA